MSTAPTPPARRGWSVRGVILAILGVQLMLAALLAGRDLVSALPQILSPSRQPALDQPIRPGDQTRRFRPADLPARPDTGPGQRISIPNPGDMPSRLRVERIDAETLLLTGTIAPGDAARLDELVFDLDAQTEPGAVRLHSPGGSVSDALEIGRKLRAAGFNTVMQDSDICLSACPYIFASGVTRRAASGALIGVHQHFFGENTVLPAFLAVEDVQAGQAEVLRHLDQMGIDLRVMQHSLSTPPDEIYILTAEELTAYRLLFEGPEPAE